MARARTLRLFLDDRQLAAIGYFLAQWTFLESEMDFTITALRHLIEDTQELPFPFDRRLQLWRKLVSGYYKTNEQKEAIEPIIENVERAHDWRSTLAHGRMLGDPSGRVRAIKATAHRHRGRRWSVYPQDIEPRDLRKMARAMGHLTLALMDFNEKHLPVSPPSLPCIFPRSYDTFRHPDRPDPNKSEPPGRPRPSLARLHHRVNPDHPEAKKLLEGQGLSLPPFHRED